MNQPQLHIASVCITPIGTSEWKLTGPEGIFRIRLVDSGGWDVLSSTLPAPEHFSMLHHALYRSYNLSLGVRT